MSETAASSYAMGHNDRERRRLALQASILNPYTENLLRRAGLVADMRVLDVGCGVGDLAIMAARLVGDGGRVTALDIDQPALDIGQERMRKEGLSNISFVHGNFDEYEPSQPFDAVIGRHILLHTPNPLALLQKAHRILSERGVAVFQEYDFSVTLPAYPPSPLREKVFNFYRDFFSSAGQVNIGSKLFHLLVEAGFAAPDCRVECPISGGADSPFYEWIAESLRSMLPRAESLGTKADIDLKAEDLTQRLKEEAVARKASFPAPLLVGAFARKLN